MPRAARSTLKSSKPAATSKSENSWVFIVKKDGLEGTGRTPDIVRLRHPSTEKPALFLFSPNDETVQEVLTFSEDKRSWFINQSVKQDGNLHFSTPFDPIFLILPYLLKSSATMPLEQLLQDEEFPETTRLLKCTGVKNMEEISDRKGDEDLKAFKYNEEKVMSWLQKKTERVADILKAKSAHVTGGSISATFVKSTIDGAASREAYLKYAHGILSDYIPTELVAKLLVHLGLPADEPPKTKRNSTSASLTDERESKKSKIEKENIVSESESTGENLIDPPKSEKQPEKVSAREKARQKAAQGSKSITSFFKKK